MATQANRLIRITLQVVGAAASQGKLSGFTDTLDDLGLSVGKLSAAGGLALIAAAAADFGRESFTAAAQAERLTVANSRLAKGLNTTTDVLVRGVQQATLGTIDKLTTLQVTNKAMLFGIAETQSEMESLARIAVTLGRATGEGTAKSFDDLVVALSRGSPLILDNLGIQLSLSQAYEEYAAQLGKLPNQLTNNEKQQAFLNVAQQKGLDLTNELGGVQQDSLSDMENYTRAVNDLKVAFGGFVTEASGGASAAASFLDNITEGFEGLSSGLGSLRQGYDLIVSGNADIAGGFSALGGLLSNSDTLLEQASEARQNMRDAKQAELDAARNQVPTEKEITDEIREQVALTNDIAMLRKGMTKFGFGSVGALSQDAGFGDLTGIQMTTVADDKAAATEIAEHKAREEERAAKQAQRAWERQQREYARQVEANARQLQSLVERNLTPTLSEVWEAPVDDRRIDENARRLADVASKGFASPWLASLRSMFGGQDFFQPIIEAINAGDGGMLQRAASSLLTSPALTQLWDIELIKQKVREDYARQNARQQLINTVMQELSSEGFSVSQEQVQTQFGGLSKQIGLGLSMAIPEGFKSANLGQKMLESMSKDLRSDNANFADVTRVLLRGIGNEMMNQIDIISDALLDALADKISIRLGGATGLEVRP